MYRLKVKTIELETAPTKSIFQGVFGRISQRQRWGFSAVVIFVILWEIISALKIIDPKYISQPSRIINNGYTLITSGDFFNHFYVSMSELFIGYILAIVVGILVGILMGYSRIIGGLFDPLIMALYATPRVALVPLFVLWFGVGMGSKIFIVFIGVVFPVLINTITGIRQVDSLLVRAGRSFGANNRQLFTKIYLPGALPAMMTGIRLGWGRGILGFVVGEMYVSMEGLGKLIQTAGNAMQTDQLFFLITFVAAIGYVGTNILSRLENKLSPWREEKQGA